MRVFDFVIIGRNVSAMSAAIYAAMSNRSTLYISCPSEVHSAEGVNRYLGFKDGSYKVFHEKVSNQLSRFSMDRLDEDVHKIIHGKQGTLVVTNNETISAKSVIVSTAEVSRLVEGADSAPVFLCGSALSGVQQKELVALAGTGVMAAIDARLALTN
ncbi:thioredoxin reductase (NADPH) [Nematocida displodere]|uniref:Thioredoxin reductase (NADPH) n=1 Tax=Nematocida displodere TaxID=1805483 RepID=A0A177EE40_9MICR|nr:thioredoxin reductase (NADPH) [Nematocida displodere]